MRLLDAPIRKQAAELTDEQKRDMMVNILIGAGGGAGAGALTEYLLTGKAGLMGTGIGAAGGAAVGAGLDDNARAKIKEFFTGKAKEQPKEEEEQPSPEEAPGESTEKPPEEAAETSARSEIKLTELNADQRQNFYDNLKKTIETQELDDTSREYAENLMHGLTVLESQEKAPRTWSQMADNPKHQKVAANYADLFRRQEGRVPEDRELGRLIYKVNKADVDPDLALAYILYHNEKKGTVPETDDIGRFLGAVEDEAVNPQDLSQVDEWLRGTHDEQLEHKEHLLAQTLAYGDTMYDYGSQLRNKLKQKALGQQVGAKGPGLLTKTKDVLKSVAGAPGALKSTIAQQGLKETGKQALAGAGGKAASLGRGLWSAGRSFVAPKFLAANILLDAPSLYVDPETGEFNYWNWWENVDKGEKMMALREAKRGQMRNMIYGGVRGTVMPWTTAPVFVDRAGKHRDYIRDVSEERGTAAGRRVAKDVAMSIVPFMTDYQFKPTAEENLGTKLRQYYVHAKNKQATMADSGEPFRIADRYDPIAFKRNVDAGNVPVLLPSGEYGWKTPRGNLRGQVNSKYFWDRYATDKDRKDLMGTGPKKTDESMVAPAPKDWEVELRRVERRKQRGEFESEDDYRKARADALALKYGA